MAKRSKTPPPLPPANHFVRYACLAIFAITFLAYATSLGGDFTNWDDPTLVSKNEAIQSLAPSNIVDIFTIRPGKTYQPVRVLSYAIDHAVWGMKPFGFHLGNSFFHALAAVLLFLVMLRAIPALAPDIELRTSQRMALLVALLFALHPANTEAVAWVSSRKYGLLASFGFGAFYCLLRADEKIGWRIGMVALTVLALLSSPFAVTLPPLFMLFDYCRDREHNPLLVAKKRLANYLPLLITFCLLGGIYYWVLVVGGDDGQRIAGENWSPFKRFCTQLRCIFDYGRNLVLPLWLNNKYVDHLSHSLFQFKVIVSLLGIVGLSVFSLCGVRKGNKVPLFCCGWVSISMLPVMNIIPISSSMADRYLYLAGVGVFLALAFAWRRLPEIAGITVGAILLASCFGGTVLRNRVWENSETLWRDSLSKDEANATAHNNWGNMLVEQDKVDDGLKHLLRAYELIPSYPGLNLNLGNAYIRQDKDEIAIGHYREEKRLQPEADVDRILGYLLLKHRRYEEALPHLQKHVQMEPDFAEVYSNLGQALAQLGQTQKAAQAFAEAFRQQPTLFEAMVAKAELYLAAKRLSEASNLTAILSLIQPQNPMSHLLKGAVAYAQGAHEQSLPHFQAAVSLSPGYARGHFALATALSSLRRDIEAIAHFRQALKVAPAFLDARFGLAMSLSRDAESATAAAQEFAAVIAANPAHARAHFNLALLRAKARDHNSAITHYRAAIAAKPGYHVAHNNLGTSLIESGDLNAGITAYREAIRHNANYANAHYNLGIALIKANQSAAALPHFERVLAIDPTNAAAAAQVKALRGQ
ncbi:MAG: tetratricopeptide (TPR) repeat protein [Rhodothermales bacterium]|jgi:tetratricopeptide (TPR) repeat protein